jgi:hypothetical protein
MTALSLEARDCCGYSGCLARPCRTFDEFEAPVSGDCAGDFDLARVQASLSDSPNR